MLMINRQNIKKKLIESCFSDQKDLHLNKNKSSQKKIGITLNQYAKSINQSLQNNKPKRKLPINYQKTASTTPLQYINNYQTQFKIIPINFNQNRSIPKIQIKPEIRYHNKQNILFQTPKKINQVYIKQQMPQRYQHVNNQPLIIQNGTCFGSMSSIITKKQNIIQNIPVFVNRQFKQILEQRKQRPSSARNFKIEKIESLRTLKPEDAQIGLIQFSNIIKNRIKNNQINKKVISPKNSKIENLDQTFEFKAIKIQKKQQKMMNSIAIQTDIKLTDIDTYLVKSHQNKIQQHDISFQNKCKFKQQQEIKIENNIIDVLCIKNEQNMNNIKKYQKKEQINEKKKQQQQQKYHLSYFGKKSKQKFVCPSQYQNFKRRQYYLQNKYKIYNFHRKN